METKLEKEVRFLKIYAAVATLVCAVFFLSAFALQNKKQKFEEIDVERINVVEKNGKLKMVLTNNEKTPDIPVGGKVISRGEQGGLYFYNEEGDECGGLVFSGQKKDGKTEAFGGLMFDQFQQDQTLQLSYTDTRGYRRAALIVQDRSNIPKPEWNERYEAAQKMKDGPEKQATLKPLLAPYRLYVGKTRENDSAVLLYDTDGNIRIKMLVDVSGKPVLEFLDASGKVIQTLPNASEATKK